MFFARFISVRIAAEVLRYYSGWADKIHGKTIEGVPQRIVNLVLSTHRELLVNESKVAYTRAEP